MIYKKYIEIPYKWLIIKDGQEVAYFHTPVFEDMFWRKVSVEPLIDNIDVYDDSLWLDCNYKIKHFEKNYFVDHAIIVASKEEQEIKVRGIPEKVLKKDWEKK